MSNAAAWWQARICDVEAAVAAVSVPGRPVRFVAELSDPVEALLPEGSAWRGCGGVYTISLGESSSATRGAADGLPVLRATINDFSRLWLGAANAAGLAMAGRIEAPRHLVDELHRLMRLPKPMLDWDL